MSEQKNIDRLFQEKLKDFEQAPSDLVWDKINESLRADEDIKKVVPLWLRLSGVAAALILLFVAGTIVFNNGETSENSNQVVGTDQEPNINNTTEDHIKDTKTITNEPPTLNKNDLGNPKNGDIALRKKKNTIISNSSVAKNHESKNQRFDNERSIDSQNSNVVINSPKKEGAIQKHPKSSPFTTDSGVVLNNATAKNNTIATKDDQHKVNLNDLSPSRSLEGQNNNALAKRTENTNASTTGNPSVNSTGNLSNNENVLVSSGEQKKLTATENSQKNTLAEANNNTYENGIAGDMNNNTAGTVINKDQINSDFNPQINVSEHTTDPSPAEKLNPNLATVLASQEKAIDSILAQNTNAIDEAVAEQLKKEEKEKDDLASAIKRWDVAPIIAPIYYNSLGDGSPIDNQFASNDKSGSLNMSYGVNVAYSFNKKWSIRSGVNQFNAGYKTNNVVVQPAPSGSNGTLKNVTLRTEASNIAVFGESSFNVSALPSDLSLRFDAFLEQEFGYLEVPLEMKYQISDKKLGIHMIGGFSTLFLNENNVYAKQPSGSRILLGAANNLNSVSFSTNIGIGFNYSISKKFNLNFEPTFKYQLNSFSENSGGFKPYIIGIYSGFSFKF
jgi:hypothetical protein